MILNKANFEKLYYLYGQRLEAFACTGGEAALTLNASVPWTASIADSKVNWLSVSPASGNAGEQKVMIKADANNISADRAATIRFKAGKISRDVAVNQLAADVLSYTTSPSVMPAAGGNLTVQVSSNIPYTLEIASSCADWITCTDTKAIDIQSHHFYISANRSDADRTGEFIIKSKEGTQNISFIQQGDNGTLPKAEGFIRYTDGTPAKDVVVSDGFSCVKTDMDGFYRLYPSSDCRYIYFSYPSDSKIEKNDLGQPDFFKKYDTRQNRYDFTLTKAAVENEFRLFAMADPQAHYVARGWQAKPETDRFRQETVPAVNKVISETAIPCYGITLGDIVHSVYNIDSTPGMTVMRSHFSLIEMPVFQVMGNHDCTFFHSTCPLQTDERSSTLFLKAQRSFEDAFGPINYSFNRGNVHIVCMRNIIYDSTTDILTSHGGFSDEQYEWLLEDLAEVGKDKMVILCVHIPLANMANGEHRRQVVDLLKQYTNSTIFSGHAHTCRTYIGIQSTYMTEHIHQAVCGELWHSNMEGDGCPNGYTTYDIKGNMIVNARLRGVNGPMASPDYQMRIHRGDMTTGGKYGSFQWKQGANKLMINVFNGSKSWKVQVYENGEYAGNAEILPSSNIWFSEIEKGKTYEIDNSSSQDWWTIGFHIGYLGYGTTGGSYYSYCYHMFKYTMKDPSASIKVIAEDTYGNKFECSEITSDCYPDYIISEKNFLYGL